MRMESEAKKSTSASVMIVEDEPVMNELVSEILQFNDFQTQGFFTGEDALLWCNRNAPDIALVDIMLPGISGYEVVHQLKSTRRTQGVATLILSSLDRHEARLRAVRAGADAYISKPFEPEALIHQMMETLQLVRRHQNLPVEGRLVISSQQEMVFLHELNHLLLALNAVDRLDEEQVRTLRAGMLELFRNLTQWSRSHIEAGSIQMNYRVSHEAMEIVLRDVPQTICPGCSPSRHSLSEKTGDFLQQAGEWEFLDTCALNPEKAEIQLLRQFS